MADTEMHAGLSRKQWGGLIIGMAVAGYCGAESIALPYQAQAQHLGVASCAGGTCHGANVEFQDSNVWQNEFVVWDEEDAHSQAYAVLLNDQSQRIARNLGLKSAHTAEICLDCHADNIQPARRGPNFKLEDGVGCEACHGGAENYRDSHYEQGATHEQNLERGLYPTEDPMARAHLCLSCHFGNDDKFVTHRIMGAGHPRMSFELDTFTADQPAHFEIDADYEERKPVWEGVQIWAIGQAIAARYYANALVEGGHTGLFPELTLFDCHSCHHSMDDKRWQPRTSAGLGPGVVRFNDSNLLMTYQLARAAAPDLAPKVRAATRALHASTKKGQSAVQQSAKQVVALMDQLQTRLAGHAFSEKDMYSVVDGLLQDGLKGEYRDYGAAEQAVMAIGSVMYTLDRAAAFSEERGDRLFKALDQVLKTLDNDEQFDPQRFAQRLRSFQALLKG